MGMKAPRPEVKRIAHERIAILFEQARLSSHLHPEWSDRYVQLARRIAMRQRVRIGRRFKRQFCRHCYTYLIPGVNVRVRVQRGKVIVTCLSCRRQMRYLLGRKHHER